MKLNNKILDINSKVSVQNPIIISSNSILQRPIFKIKEKGL